MIVKLVKTENRAKFLPHSYPLVILGIILVAAVLKKGTDVLLINGHHTPSLDVLFAVITHLGDGIVFVPILLMAILVRYRYAAVVLMTLAGNAVLVSLCKQFLFAAQERPRQFLGDAAVHFVAGIDVHRLHSFPSGHTATAFSAAALIALLTRNTTAANFALLMASLVGYSRIYLAQHFVTDVAAGALAGCLTALIAWQFFDNRRLPRWLNSRVNLT